MSTRKPHNDLAGYVCELNSKHPKLPGHLAIFDRDNDGSWVTGEDGERWGLLHLKADGTNGGVCTFSSLRSARGFMKEMANGSNVVDLGQNSEQ